MQHGPYVLADERYLARGKLGVGRLHRTLQDGAVLCAGKHKTNAVILRAVFSFQNTIILSCPDRLGTNTYKEN